MLNWLLHIKIVKFGDKYALRKGWVFYSYLDSIHGFWLDRWSIYFHYCLIKDLSKLDLPVYGKPLDKTKKEN